MHMWVNNLKRVHKPGYYSQEMVLTNSVQARQKHYPHFFYNSTQENEIRRVLYKNLNIVEKMEMQTSKAGGKGYHKQKTARS